MEKKKISVILTTFNGAKYIKQQLDSILIQELLPQEIIICDDQSTDDTLSILNAYSNNKDVRIKIFENKKRLGVVENFKMAAKLVEAGNWLAFSDQDDIWISEKLKKLASEMQSLDDDITPALIYSDMAIINKEGTLTDESFWNKQKIFPEKINLARLLYGNVVTGCTMLINQAMIREFAGMDDQRFFHDEWLALIAYSFGNVKFLPEKLVLYRQHESNLTFSQDYKPSKVLEDLKDNVKYISGKKKFLTYQFDLAKAFLKVYRHKLAGDQATIFDNFIKQENKNYLSQRVSRKITYL